MKTIDPVEVSMREEYLAAMRAKFAESHAREPKFHPEGKYTIKADPVRKDSFTGKAIWKVTTPEGITALYISWENALKFVDTSAQLRFDSYVKREVERLWNL